MQRQRLHLRPMLQHPAARHTGAAAPVQNRAALRLPAAGREFAQNGVPLPSDALGKGRVVKRKIALRTPVIRRSRRAVEKALPKFLERRDFLRGPNFHARLEFTEEPGEALFADAVKIQQRAEPLAKRGGIGRGGALLRRDHQILPGVFRGDKFKDGRFVSVNLH